MKYLACTINGFLKKFPLNKPELSLGRLSSNDIVIDHDSVSRKHNLIFLKEHSILVKDNRTTNGTFVNLKRVKEAELKTGQSFTIGDLEFILKEGTSNEFKLAKEYTPCKKDDKKSKINDSKNLKTRLDSTIYEQLLNRILLTGMKMKSYQEFMAFLAQILADLAESGSLFLISKQGREIITHLAITNRQKGVNLTKIAMKPGFFKEKIIPKKSQQTGTPVYSYPFKMDNKDACLAYICHTPLGKQDAMIQEFLSALAKEIELLSQLYKEKMKKDDLPQTSVEEEEDIVVANKKMKALVDQVKKIANSDIFILLQGESGTGKELFARLIHKNSKRNQKKFVAINCAAIPENLLESELFGHEKGAFTGAYEKKIGKLEMASEGTMVFDEIGDMPLSLQTKLLRALQENEFYRLGGASTIKVDLRIIAITNQNLKQLVQEKKFRQDLYFRIVHRTVTIPPLRERPEDISKLINFFTHKFCEKTNKNISGYSVKAFDLLQDYVWPGNVRQLENEIKSLVNLTPDGEVINHEILSDEIKGKNLLDEYNKSEIFQKGFYQKPDKNTILELLEKNNWNRAKTARELNMTYQGLHKKIKKLGIKRL